jgi:hypothetical protein
MQKTKRWILTTGLALGLILGGSSMALASNDPRVPGDDCSGNEKAIGQPFGGNAVDIGPAPVQGPASLNNPSGTSPGAQGQANYSGGARC